MAIECIKKTDSFGSKIVILISFPLVIENLLGNCHCEILNLHNKIKFKFLQKV